MPIEQGKLLNASEPEGHCVILLRRTCRPWSNYNEGRKKGNNCKMDGGKQRIVNLLSLI